MGFINYRGPKEDHYFDVLEFAKNQQEEEQRRLAISRANRHVAELTGNSQIADMDANELLKLIIVRYRKLSSLKEPLENTAFIHASIDEHRLWADFSLWIIEKHLNLFDIPHESRIRYLQTFYTKVFRVSDGAPLDEHISYMLKNSYYRCYFEDCFDLSKGMYYWKWLRDSGENATTKKNEFNAFADLYFDLAVLLVYYLFLSFIPFSDEWASALSAEKSNLENLKNCNTGMRFKVVDITKLANPVYRKAFALPDFANTPSLIKKKLEGLEALLSTQTFASYIQACQLLISCKLPEKMHAIYVHLIERLRVLNETIEKFKDVYQPDLYQFYDYYIPEAMRLTATYLEYVDAKVSDQIVCEAEKEVMLAVDTLLLAVNEKIDEVYRFAAIDIKAKAKALDAIMNQDGYVDPVHKIN